MIGISINDGGFELRCGEPIGRRRYFDAETIARLREFSSRYAKLREQDGSQSAAGLLMLGRQLFGFLDGDAGDLTALMNRAPRPLHFEIVADRRRPSEPEMALLRAPWELLANAQGFLAADVLLTTARSDD